MFRDIQSKGSFFRVLFFSLGIIVSLTGCNTLPSESEASAQQRQSSENQTTPVDIATARTGRLTEQPEYTGTTAPAREVSLRSQVTGQVLNMTVDIGDPVNQGQTVARLDDALLVSAVNQAEAELASLRAAVARAQNQVSNAQAQVERSRLELQQAQADLARQQRLLQEGAVPAQQAEQARTEAQTAVQILRAAQEQVRTEQQAVAAAQSQVTAQQAVVAQARRQQSYARLTAPIAGKVMQRLTEVGNFVQPNTEIVRIGDFSRIQVNVEVSELELASIRQGQAVTVRLDAFPDESFTGEVSRISPAADQTARLIPIQVVIPNNNGQIGSGLLARVQFESEVTQRVVVPQTALSPNAAQGTRQEQESTIFVVAEGTATEKEGTVTARSVTLGESANGQVEILSGLQAGERFVARSGGTLTDGATVRFSILSES
ncbi:efflux RND transporter periplasmic adaptor subunit [Gloeocapsopsis dulcis]|uniref:efflux RND transporter periplasmic adaptor subunit n=1 Tax=Gloeocapsopsis dulcis TaxID=2859516 RepID=UPI001F1D4757|nr:efflux RND transporter periplasmic adaptor subunit [Gloeocapsopsis dulcis]WNN91046.1 efflux RND transporter periplasmic adaptor subunit [Gloeocapsopsis dulcis]